LKTSEYELKRKIKKVWPEEANNLTEIRRANLFMAIVVIHHTFTCFHSIFLPLTSVGRSHYLDVAMV